MVQTLLDIGHDSRRSGALPPTGDMGRARAGAAATSALVSRAKDISDSQEHKKCNCGDYRQVDGCHLPVPPNQSDTNHMSQ